MIDADWSYLLPHLSLAAGGSLVLCEAMIFGERRHGIYLSTTLLAGALSLTAALCLHGEVGTAFAGALVIDGTVTALLAVLSVGALLGALCSPAYLNRYGLRPSDYYALLLFSVCGMEMLVSAGDLALLFVALETLSVCVYALTGYRTQQLASNEAALKYFLLGAFATGFLLYGMAFLYGAAGTTNLAEISRRLLAAAGEGQSRIFATLGLGLMLVGLGFKVGAVPFHMWVPDAYQGAPTPVTAFMSVAVKAAAVGVLLRMVLALAALADLWVPLLGGLSLATMVVGNLLALRQDNVKRMLAYSSVSHAGYLLLGVMAAAIVPGEASAAVIFYLLVYSFMNVGAFAVLIALSPRSYERTRYADLEGLSERRPLLSALLALFMLALAGIPPTGGFAAKFYLFAAVLHAGHPLLAALGVLASVVGVVYYLRVVVCLYMGVPGEGAAQATAPRGLALTLALAACALLTLELGLQILPGLGAFAPGYLQEIATGILAQR